VIVVDTNIVAYLYIESEFTAKSEALLREDPDWAAPLLWRSEFRNVLAGGLRRNLLTFEDALQFAAEAEALLAGNEHEVSSQQVLELVRDSECSAYDCEFVALAKTLRVPLVTMDARLLKAFPKLARPFTAV
jgi:predicted nucleic acid-binding protein